MRTIPVDRRVIEEKTCGFFVMRPDRSFLLLKFNGRYDLPKGHTESGETELQTAFRELFEETGIKSNDIFVDRRFRFKCGSTKLLTDHRNRTVTMKTTYIIFLAYLKSDPIEIILSEHDSFHWHPWRSSFFSLQPGFIDFVIHAVQAHLYR